MVHLVSCGSRVFASVVSIRVLAPSFVIPLLRFRHARFAPSVVAAIWLLVYEFLIDMLVLC